MTEIRRKSQTPTRVLGLTERPYLDHASTLSDEGTRVLKQGETFAIFDRRGDIRPAATASEGLFHGDTRFLSGTTLTINHELPVLLASTVKEASGLLTVDLTNGDLELDEGHLPQGGLHLFRAKLIWRGVLYERVRVTNYTTEHLNVPLDLHVDADFADIFEVKGKRRERRGRALEPHVTGDRISLGYEGLDGVVRRSHLDADPAPDRVNADGFAWRLGLEPRESINIFVRTVCEVDGERFPRSTFREALQASCDHLAAGVQRSTHVTSDNASFDDWMRRSITDLQLMAAETKEGVYPHAGVPWFSTTFGRDGIIVGLQTLWADPNFARGVLGHLAATQADSVVAEEDAEPGKILHEARSGEMALLGEVPFRHYYGTVDAPALFVMLAGAYLDRAGDEDFVHRLWPHVERALAWMETHGDPDGDGFVEYDPDAATGLRHQGWKDSADPVFHADGRDAEGSIALSEVQGYAYAARKAAARIAQSMGETATARRLHRDAADLRKRFDDAFWLPELDTYALAIDGNGDPCAVRTSNAGHCLYTGISYVDRAERLANTLLSDDSFSGFGIRTLARGEPRFNPMSYHNGSIWPHDNAMIAAGLARYGFTRDAVTVMDGIFHAADHSDLHRLPELFCGFTRRADQGPTLYPVACSPQAWAAGSVFMLLQSVLGLEVDAATHTLTFARPALPTFVSRLHLRNLHLGNARADVTLRRHEGDVGVSVDRREGPLDVVVLH